MNYPSKSFLVLSFFLCSLPLAAQDVPRRERLSPYGLAKPVLIVAGELPKEFENKDNVPVLNTAKDVPPAGFQFLQKRDEQPTAGKVGVYVPSGAVFSINRRAMSNKGEGVVTLRLAKSVNREARTIELKGKKSADYNELCRCAAERAAGSLWPPKKTGEPTVPKGTLVIVGGGGMTPEIAKAFINGGGGENGHFVVLPISMPDPINTRAEETFLRKMGAKNVAVIPYREQKDLEDPKTLDVLKKATGVWFGGGRQWNFMDGYEGTQLPTLFNDVLARGGVIGGSSAGATIQGDYMVRGAPAGSNIMMCEGYERALGFLPGTAIDQHFSARKRFGDMTAFMKAYPQFLGIGLDEATAIVVRGSTAEILGKGKVYFYDSKRRLKEGQPDYEAFTAGTKYDLKERREIQ
jgi:cyanophycinase